ncbi:MAG: hypothetical protein D6689_19605 [Deltaproteobacteria bacterium]|nr:MAG: hypothetical protein D6689_19605 [Deltaproteobacteria bacterium]
MSFKPRRHKDRSDPFAMLERSHERLQQQLDTLLGAAAVLNDDPADAGARRAVVAVSEFLTRAAVRHEQDEEQSLFPRLADAGADLAALLDRLAVEHRAHETLHNQLADIAASCDRPLSAATVAELSDIAMTLAQVYAKHIETEETLLFPAARAHLDAAARAAIAAEMQARRGR